MDGPFVVAAVCLQLFAGVQLHAPRSGLLVSTHCGCYFPLCLVKKYWTATSQNQVTHNGCYLSIMLGQLLACTCSLGPGYT